MKVQKIQSQQQSFGTKVLVKKSTKELLLKSPAKREFLRHIEKLENNGIDDVMILTHQTDTFFSLNTTWLRGIVFEKRGNNLYKTPWGSEDSLVYSLYAKDVSRNEYANILNLYKEAKNNWQMRRTDCETYDKFTRNTENIKD